MHKRITVLAQLNLHKLAIKTLSQELGTPLKKYRNVLILTEHHSLAVNENYQITDNTVNSKYSDL
ncbi:MAG: hypothetical protein PWR03_377 [Tenuifilum sp.]|jgi:hypothetical protein|nr:hypothetical protein [Tenuifilum sp.]